MPKEKERAAQKEERPRHIPDLKKGQYSDGHPLDEVQYSENKIILKPDRFTSRKSFWEFAKIVHDVAKKSGIGFSTEGFEDERPQIREVLFMDTADFRLYNNALIVRRRVQYHDGFPVGEPEIVFKFRHPDMQTAADMDVRPSIAGDFRIKFKVEALPAKESIGSFRTLFSHNVQFPASHAHEADRTSFATLVRAFPLLAKLKRSEDEKLELVSETIIEEVLQDIGILDLGKGITAKTNVALWRARGDHRPLVGEFAFQVKFNRRDDVHQKTARRGEEFFVALQYAAQDWLLLHTTKTGIVYRLKGNPPQNHE